MSSYRKILLACVLLSVAGCYHARIETGLEPSARVIEQSFASGWIYGLVPPSTVRAGEACPNGVAVVETQLSFVNQLVSALTLGIYTPMHIRVTCATGGSASLMWHFPEDGFMVAHEMNDEQVTSVFEEAAHRAVSSREPVFVLFEKSYPFDR